MMIFADDDDRCRRLHELSIRRDAASISDAAFLARPDARELMSRRAHFETWFDELMRKISIVMARAAASCNISAHFVIRRHAQKQFRPDDERDDYWDFMHGLMSADNIFIYTSSPLFLSLAGACSSQRCLMPKSR